jgi:23S rRNA (guanosine2251-2'-O)-methyltransferase
VERVYGIHAVESLLRNNPESVQNLWLRRGRHDRRLRDLLKLAREQGVDVQFESRESLDGLVDGRHQGAVAEVSPQAETRADLTWSEARLLVHVDDASGPLLLLVLDGVTDPHNLGACLRSADAAGVDAVIAPKDKSAGLTAVARKVACGAAETVPFVQVTNLRRTLEALKARGVWLYGADSDSEKSLYDNKLTSSLALVLGAEGSGLRRLTRETCDELVHLPMAGAVSSLNVSVAAGICLFEVVRQRRAPPC